MLDPKNAPTCKKCDKTAIVADAGVLTSIPYWYCKSCKQELDSAGNPPGFKKTAPTGSDYPTHKYEGYKGSVLDPYSLTDPDYTQIGLDNLSYSSESGDIGNLSPQEYEEIVKRFSGY